MTLSDKILKNIAPANQDYLLCKDVKEFIKELKEDKCNCPICMKWKKRINRLAGEDLCVKQENDAKGGQE